MMCNGVKSCDIKLTHLVLNVKFPDLFNKLSSGKIISSLPLYFVMYRVAFCRISQRSNMILCGLIYAAWILGILSDYEQNLALYSVFSGLNTCIGICVFLMHSLGNHEVSHFSILTLCKST